TCPFYLPRPPRSTLLTLLTPVLEIAYNLALLPENNGGATMRTEISSHNEGIACGNNVHRSRQNRIPMLPRATKRADALLADSGPALEEIGRASCRERG